MSIALWIISILALVLSIINFIFVYLAVKFIKSTREELKKSFSVDNILRDMDLDFTDIGDLPDFSKLFGNNKFE